MFVLECSYCYYFIAVNAGRSRQRGHHGWCCCSCCGGRRKRERDDLGSKDAQENGLEGRCVRACVCMYLRACLCMHLRACAFARMCTPVLPMKTLSGVCTRTSDCPCLPLHFFLERCAVVGLVQAMCQVTNSVCTQILAITVTFSVYKILYCPCHTEYRYG
jgi:hypothetical protein